VVESVYSAVRTDSLYCIKQITFRLLKVNEQLGLLER